MADDIKIIQLPLPINWDSVWQWGNPMLKPPRSDARFFPESTYEIMRQVIGVNFWKTLEFWRNALSSHHAEEYDLLKIVMLRREAESMGIQSVQDYIAARMPFSQATISRLEQLIDVAINIDHLQDELKYREYDIQNLAYVFDGNNSKWTPSSLDIQKAKLAVPRDCAGGWDGCLGESTNGKVPLCFPCHSKALRDYGSSFLFPDWLQSEIIRIRKEHYDAAREYCYKKHYGSISYEHYAEYLDSDYSAA